MAWAQFRNVPKCLLLTLKSQGRASHAHLISVIDEKGTRREHTHPSKKTPGSSWLCENQQNVAKRSVCFSLPQPLMKTWLKSETRPSSAEVGRTDQQEKKRLFRSEKWRAGVGREPLGGVEPPSEGISWCNEVCGFLLHHVTQTLLQGANLFLGIQWRVITAARNYFIVRMGMSASY